MPVGKTNLKIFFSFQVSVCLCVFVFCMPMLGGLVHLYLYEFDPLSGSLWIILACLMSCFFFCMPLTAHHEFKFSFVPHICLFSNFQHFLSVLHIICSLSFRYSVPLQGFYVGNCSGFLPRFSPNRAVNRFLTCTAQKVDSIEHRAIIQS